MWAFQDTPLNEKIMHATKIFFSKLKEYLELLFCLDFLPMQIHY